VEELPALERLYQALKGRGFVVVGVGIDDTVENLETRARSLGVTFPILVDRGSAKETFKLTGVPETLLLDREGKLLLMLDPDTGQASSRILGPRDWDEPKMVRRIASLLAQ
jgi:peroxiredoxin